MKTMTCTQLGGPCDLALTGENADDVIKQQDRHQSTKKAYAVLPEEGRDGSSTVGGS